MWEAFVTLILGGFEIHHALSISLTLHLSLGWRTTMQPPCRRTPFSATTRTSLPTQIPIQTKISRTPLLHCILSCLFVIWHHVFCYVLIVLKGVWYHVNLLFYVMVPCVLAPCYVSMSCDVWIGTYGYILFSFQFWVIVLCWFSIFVFV